MRSKASRAFEEFLLQRRLARGDGARHPITQRIEQRAVRFALVLRHGAQRLEQFADRSLLAERRDAHGFQRGLVGGARDGVEDLTLEGLNVAHGKPQFETA